MTNGLYLDERRQANGGVRYWRLILQVLLITIGVWLIWLILQDQSSSAIGTEMAAIRKPYKTFLWFTAAAFLALFALKRAPTVQSFVGLTPLMLISCGMFLFALINLPVSMHQDWTHFHISDRLSQVGSLKIFGSPQADGFYRPIGFLSLYIDRLILGPKTDLYHLQSVFLHMCNAILLSAVCVNLCINRRASILAGAIFLLHPAAFECLVWPAARFDLLAAFFGLLCILAASRICMGASAIGWKVLLFISALGAGWSKESGVAFVLLSLILVVSERKNCGINTVRVCILIGLVVFSLTIIPRVLIYGSLGGYSYTGESPHFAISWRSAYAFCSRLIPGSLSIVNFEETRDHLTDGALVVWVVSCAALGLSSTVLRTCDIAKLCIAIIAFGLPVLNIVGWINGGAQHARYVYAPALIGSVLVSGAMAGAARSLSVSFLLSSGLILNHNIKAYTTSSEMISIGVAEADRLCNSACLFRVGTVPRSRGGTMYFAEEVRWRIEEIQSVVWRKAPASIDAIIEIDWSDVTRSFLVRRRSTATEAH